MSNPSSLRTTAFFAAGGFAAALFLGGAAYAITEATFKYSSPQTGHLAIPAAAFVPKNNTQAYDNGGFFVHPTTTSRACFSAPVNLPTKAKMTELALWYARVNGDTFDLSLFRHRLSDGVMVEIVGESPPPNGGVRGVAVYPITSQTVDSEKYAYFILVCMQNSTTPLLVAVRMAYTYTSAGD